MKDEYTIADFTERYSEASVRLAQENNRIYRARLEDSRRALDRKLREVEKSTRKIWLELLDK